MRFSTVCVLSLLTLLAHSMNAQNGIQSVELDKDSAFTVCPMDRHHCSKEAARIKISPFPKSDNTSLTFYYVPTGGKIVGEGSNVTWDLSEVSPGTYSMTVGLGKNGVIRGKTVTKTIKVEECPHCDLPCTCPSIRIDGPTDSVSIGDLFIVQATISFPERLMNKWTISSGELVDGQGSDRILVKATTIGAIHVKLNLLDTNPACACPTEVLEIINVQKRR